MLLEETNNGGQKSRAPGVRRRVMARGTYPIHQEEADKRAKTKLLVLRRRNESYGLTRSMIKLNNVLHSPSLVFKEGL